jgi:hypothetical protein
LGRLDLGLRHEYKPDGKRESTLPFSLQSARRCLRVFPLREDFLPEDFLREDFLPEDFLPEDMGRLDFGGRDDFLAAFIA